MVKSKDEKIIIATLNKTQAQIQTEQQQKILCATWQLLPSSSSSFSSHYARCSASFFLLCLFCLVFVYIVLYYCMLPLDVNKVVQNKAVNYLPFQYCILVRVVLWSRFRFWTSSPQHGRRVVRDGFKHYVSPSSHVLAAAAAAECRPDWRRHYSFAPF